jgi:hypothetical protein
MGGALFAQPPAKAGDFPRIHFAVPSDDINRRFFAEYALFAAEAEKLPAASRTAFYASAGVKLKLRASDALLVLRESLRFDVEHKRELARLVPAPDTKAEDAQKLRIERNRVQSRLVREAMQRIHDGLDTRGRNRLQATIYTKYDFRPTAKAAVKAEGAQQ